MSTDPKACSGIGNCIDTVCQCGEWMGGPKCNEVTLLSIALITILCLIVVVAIGTIIICIISGVVYKVHHRHKKQVSELKVELLEKEQLWTLKKEDLVFGDKISSGAFGVVYQGTHKQTPVAIKAIWQNTDSREFENEVKVLQNIRHPNLVVSYLQLLTR